MLGERFTGAVTVRAGQTVVGRGAYCFVRHPSYTAAFLIYLGIGFTLTNGWSLGTLVLGPLARRDRERGRYFHDSLRELRGRWRAAASVRICSWRQCITSWRC